MKWALALLVVTPYTAQSGHAADNPVFAYSEKPHVALVHVLALSTTIRDVSGNQDVYLARIEVKGQPPTFAKLIDSYPYYQKPIRRSLLERQPALQMLLNRSPDQDGSTKQFFLSSNPADLFDPSSTRQALSPDEAATIPCFTVVHQRTRLMH